MKENIKQLQEVVEQQHNCTARFIKSTPVLEAYNGEVVWQGIVNVFNIKGNPLATQCYAWSSPIEGSTKRHFYVISALIPSQCPSIAGRPIPPVL